MSAKAASLLVRGVRWTTSPAMLKQYLSQFGKVKFCRIIYNLQTGYSRNFARVDLDMSVKGAKELTPGSHMVNQFPVEILFQERKASLNPDDDQEQSQ